MGAEERAKAILEAYPAASFPSAILLLGEQAEAKEKAAEATAERLGLPFCDATERLSWDFLSELYASAERRLYFIDAEALDAKKQGAVLKFLEDPAADSPIIVSADSEASVLGALANRCQTASLGDDPREEVAESLPAGLSEEGFAAALRTVRTAESAAALSGRRFEALREICEKAATRMGEASLQNALSIADKISYGGKGGGSDESALFLRLLLDALSRSGASAQAYSAADEAYCAILKDKRLSRRNAIEETVARLWLLASRGKA